MSCEKSGCSEKGKPYRQALYNKGLARLIGHRKQPKKGRLKISKIEIIFSKLKKQRSQKIACWFLTY
ncbi:hypothetical protein VAEKB19_3940007 [Vibrio aestuarianus]|nr:hypothetical protein VAEKB19_3940007 [Vibrio aestuarianus]